jgi:sarcosine oxidase, subunit alpha
MTNQRILQHPIINIEKKEQVLFYWDNNPYTGLSKEPISSALIANGISIFGHHSKDGSPQSIFCANGQCSQCMVIANGMPVKACITPIQNGMQIEPANGLITLPKEIPIEEKRGLLEINIPVLIIGGGPVGLSAALELAQAGIRTLLIDDKQSLGGKLVLQTHRFFGSTKTVYAGTRGIEIADRLSARVMQSPVINVWTNSTALAVFSDKKVGILKDGNQYALVKPDHLLIACGAREKSLTFKGNTLPGVLGAGAFQTLVNRDLVYPGKKVFIIGGGNVGLITGFHALQAGIQVAGLVEVLPECGGYKVHQDNLKRLGVPFYLSHTIMSANGREKVKSVTIARVNEDYFPIPGTEMEIPCDCVLVAVGLNPVDDFLAKSRGFGMSVQAAGDAEEIAEASAAMISGKMKAVLIARKMGKDIDSNLVSLNSQLSILSSKPGLIMAETNQTNRRGQFPVIHCVQEIPCDPCSVLCPLGLIEIDQADIRKLPQFRQVGKDCSGCMNCVAGCPGHAITLVDFRKDDDFPYVSIPFEFNQDHIKIGDLVIVTDLQGEPMENARVEKIIQKKAFNSTKLITVRVAKEKAVRIAGYRVQNNPDERIAFEQASTSQSENIICRCERVSKEEIVKLIRSGYKDLNEIKSLTRAGMGACGGKTCQKLILQVMKDEKVELDGITETTRRPLFCEVPIKYLANMNDLKE